MTFRRQRLIAILIGAVLWLAAARVVHYFPFLFDGGEMSAIAFAAIIVTSWFTVDILRLATRCSPGRLAPLMVWGTLTALMLDGLVISFAPSFYASVSSATQFGAAAIMWGAGLGLLFALIRDSAK